MFAVLYGSAGHRSRWHRHAAFAGRCRFDPWPAATGHVLIRLDEEAGRDEE